MSAQIFCSNCDANIGTRVIDGLCSSVCNKWYDECIENMYCEEPHFDNCGDGGQKLYKITSNATEFCERMGYHVGHH